MRTEFHTRRFDLPVEGQGEIPLKSLAYLFAQIEEEFLSWENEGTKNVTDIRIVGKHIEIDYSEEIYV